MNKVPGVLRERPGWAPTTHPGEGVNVEIIESSNHRVLDMCLSSHFMTGVTAMEQSKDFLLGDRQHVCEGCDHAGVSYIDNQDIIL